MCSASKRCSVSGFNCICLNPHIKITLIELPQLPEILELAPPLNKVSLRICASPIGKLYEIASHRINSGKPL